MLDKILNPWKLIPSLLLLGTIGYYVITYNQQKTKIAELKTEKKTLTDSLKTLNSQVQTLDKEIKDKEADSFEDSRNFANRELSYQTTIAQMTKDKKAQDQLIADMKAGLMCREEYGWPKKKVRIVPCNPE